MRIGSLGVIALSIFCFSTQALSDPLPWTQEAGFRVAEVRPQGAGATGFTLMDPQSTGVRFTNTFVGDAPLTNAVGINGSGVALGDVDGDGWVDIYFCNLQGPNR